MRTWWCFWTFTTSLAGSRLSLFNKAELKEPFKSSDSGGSPSLWTAPGLPWCWAPRPAAARSPAAAAAGPAPAAATSRLGAASCCDAGRCWSAGPSPACGSGGRAMTECQWNVIVVKTSSRKTKDLTLSLTFCSLLCSSTTSCLSESLSCCSERMSDLRHAHWWLTARTVSSAAFTWRAERSPCDPEGFNLNLTHTSSLTQC